MSGAPAAQANTAQLEPWMRATAFLLACIVMVFGFIVAMWRFAGPQAQALDAVNAFAIISVSTVAAAFLAVLGGLISWEQFERFWKRVADFLKPDRSGQPGSGDKT